MICLLGDGGWTMDGNTSRVLVSVVVVSLASAATGCTSSEGGSRAVVRDSAGVGLVEHRSLPQLHLEIDTEPVSSVGTAAGEAGQLLHRVRGAALLDSTLVIADGGSSRLLYFGGDSLIVEAGASGDGPGEFQRLSRFFAVGDDTVAAFDARNRRLSYFSAEGEFLGSGAFGTTEEGGVLTPIGSFADGLLVEAQPPPLISEQTGFVRDSVSYHLMSFETVGGLPLPVAAQPGYQRWVVATEEGGGWRPVLLGRTPGAAVCRDGFYLADGDSYAFRFHGVDGRLRRVIRVDRASRDVTEEILSATIEEFVAGVSDPSARAAQERALRETPHPETLPAHGEIVASPDCKLWVRDYPLPGEPPRWTVFGADGEARGRAEMPAGFDRLLAVYGDQIIGLFVDELGIERVRVHRVVPGDG